MYLSERRAPLGYDSNGRRLYHSQDNIFIAVAAAFMQSSIAVLDASTATPSFVVVRTARIGVRSQEDDDLMVEWARYNNN